MAANFLAQGNAQGHVYGVPPPTPESYVYQHSPLGNLAAYKGDLLAPIVNVGFFIVGVAIIVKLLLSLAALIKIKIETVKGIGHPIHRRKRSSPSSPGSDSGEELDGLTSVVMAALDSQECLQRMTCELGAFVHRYDKANLITGLAGQLTPSIYQDQVKAFQRAGDCFQYKCGRSSSNNRRT